MILYTQLLLQKSSQMKRRNTTLPLSFYSPVFISTSPQSHSATRDCFQTRCIADWIAGGTASAALHRHHWRPICWALRMHIRIYIRLKNVSCVLWSHILLSGKRCFTFYIMHCIMVRYTALCDYARSLAQDCVNADFCNFVSYGKIYNSC